MTHPDDPAAGPPPPPPTADPERTFDFAKPFTFVFEDPAWVPKILIGGLFQLLATFLVGVPFLLGYYAKLIRNVIAGEQRPLPDWNDLGGYFVEGLKLFCVGLLYLIPVFGVVLLLVFPAIALEQTVGGEWIGAVFGCLLPLIMFPLALAVAVILPAAVLRVVALERFSAAFELGEVFRLIRACGFNYLLAIVIHLGAQFLAQFGILLCFVGVFFTGFWAMAVSAHGFGQAYRLAKA